MIRNSGVKVATTREVYDGWPWIKIKISVKNSWERKLLSNGIHSFFATSSVCIHECRHLKFVDDTFHKALSGPPGTMMMLFFLFQNFAIDCWESFSSISTCTTVNGGFGCLAPSICWNEALSDRNVAIKSQSRTPCCVNAYEECTWLTWLRSTL